MGNYLNPGNEGFARISKMNYIDKTGLIGRINETISSSDNLTCISRPRRFGKSYAAQMLCAYYDKTCDSRALFDSRKVSCTGHYREHMNRYDVIYLDMTAVIGETESSDLVPYIKRNLIREIRETYPSVSVEESFTSTLLNMVTAAGNKIIMIIDEWDAPIREGKNRPAVQREYLEFLRLLFKNSAQTANLFAAAYLTGILPIKKDGSESAVSDFQEYSFLDPGSFVEFTGFTEEEVRELCAREQMDFSGAKQWYDGYSFCGGRSIYNPYSVMTAVKRKKYRSYWRHTSAADALATYINMNYRGLQEDILRLIAGEPIEVRTDSYQNDLESFKNKDDVLTLMIHLGYLAFDEDTGYARIPNEEVRGEFARLLEDGDATKLAALIRTSDRLLADTLAGDSDAVAEAIERIRLSEYAPGFYNNEQALRYVIKFAYIVCVDKYLRIEELPSGKGIADVVFLPRKNTSYPAMVVELKWNQTSQAAVSQIRDKRYPAVLEGYEDEIVLVGLNYDASNKTHTCEIERVQRGS